MIEGYCTTMSRVLNSERRIPGKPDSAASGDVLQFHLSTDADYTVTYVRLRSPADNFEALPLGPSFLMAAPGLQAIPSAPPSACNWPVAFELNVPGEWASGIYAAHCQIGNGDDYYIVFIVKPPRRDVYDRRFAVLANTNTWNAYNDWGGWSNYTDIPTDQLSFERPNPSTRPTQPFPRTDFKKRPQTYDDWSRTSDEGTRHQTRAELWILSWLEDSHYAFDVFSDLDFHAGTFDPTKYAGLILGTHPEYWSIEMRDRLDGYLAVGGKLVYLGGNGLYERVVYSDDFRTMLLRQSDDHRGDRDYFRDHKRPERAVLGVAYRNCDDSQWQKVISGYRTKRPQHRFFNGTNLNEKDPFGDIGLTGAKLTAADGRACASETDNTLEGGGELPPGLEILAESCPPFCQMTSYDTETGGFVFSASSVTFGGSLAIDPIVQHVVRNVLDECLWGMTPPVKLRPGTIPEWTGETAVLRWMIQGVIGFSPTGQPHPVPPRGPANDMLLGLLVQQTSNQVSSAEERRALRRAGLELVARTAERELKNLK